VPYYCWGPLAMILAMDKGNTTQPAWALRAKLLMRDQRVTQESLAKMLGTTRGAVGHYFRGRREPDIDTLVIIAKALGVTVSHLTGELPLSDDPQAAREVEQLVQSLPADSLPLILDMLRAASGRDRKA